MDDRTWMSQAICAGLDPAVFFPGRNENSDAKTICKGCPVREECLEYAVTHRITDGIWGGYGERTRQRMRRQRAQAARSGI